MNWRKAGISPICLLIAGIQSSLAASTPPIPGLSVPSIRNLGAGGGGGCTPGTTNRYAITTGTTSWTVPAGVNCVTVYAIGAGGNGQGRGASSGIANGGGGGSFAKLNNYATIPAASITVQVAAAGSGSWRCTTGLRWRSQRRRQRPATRRCRRPPSRSTRSCRRARAAYE